MKNTFDHHTDETAEHGESAEQLLRELKTLEPPHGLSERILVRVRKRALARRAETCGLYFLLAAAIAASLWSGIQLAAQLGSSPLPDLLRLLVTDASATLQNFADWAVAIVEALPVQELVIIAAGIFVALLVIRGLAGMRRTGKDLLTKA